MIVRLGNRYINTLLNFKDVTEIMGYLFARGEITDWSVESYDIDSLFIEYDENFKKKEFDEIKSQVK